MKKLGFLLLISLMIVVFMGNKPKDQQKIQNPDTFIYASHGNIDSLDPAKAYDNSSGAIIQNIYETLIFFDGPAVDKFVPMLAETVPTIENGGILNGGKTYKFKIRKGVTFHSGTVLTPENVRYSFLRNMITDPDNSPMWLLYFPLLGTYGSRDGDGNISVSFKDLENAIQVDKEYVIFNLKNPFPAFLAILAGYWGSVVDKEFIIKNGGWDGTEATWQKFNNPATGKENLVSISSGTGPYKLVRLESGVEVVMERNEKYWGPKPAMRKAIYKVVDEWSLRKLMLLQGDADVVEVDPLYYEEMDQESGLTVYSNLKELGFRAINFNLKINTKDNPSIGSGQLDGKGIPGDFFSDKNVRIAFQYSWDKKTYINDIIKGNGIESPSPIVSGLPYRNDALKGYDFNLAKAAEYFKKAFNGKLWEVGFQMEFLYNSGNETRESALKLLAEKIMSVNSKFKITVRGVEWAAFLQANKDKTMPLFYLGWGADYPHPDNFMSTYMHSEGHFGATVSYNNPEVDKLLEAGAIELNPAKAKEIYFKLQDLWIEEAIGIGLNQPVIKHYFRDWVKGYYYHPMENPYLYKMFRKEM